ncbi:hypothetical protein B5M09_011946 [Aphanomyces astaci]|uniref:Uncharacterized protein n=1 Tax=Aphanomyces astaci TaxID=112090 RepID=A0A3R8D570_APHAT|nr:hypothetical protein B5M09_011946 [Aphanomyces astaci]
MGTEPCLAWTFPNNSVSLAITLQFCILALFVMVRGMTYQNKWALKFGIEISELDPITSQVTSCICLFFINGIIGELMFKKEDEVAAVDQEEDDDVDGAVVQAEKLVARAANSNRRAMVLFVEQEDGSYVATIKTPMKFELSIGYVSAGMSFRQTAKAVGMTHRTCNIAKLAGLNDTIVGQWVRILVGGYLQQIANLLADDDIWAFALAFDGGTHRGTTFFDVRIRFGFRGVLYNMHMIALPQFERHTAANIVNLVVKIMNALYSRWRKKIIGVAADGEPMTSRIQGVVTKIVEEGEIDFIRIWCIPHQMDLVVRATTEAVAMWQVGVTPCHHLARTHLLSTCLMTHPS